MLPDGWNARTAVHEYGGGAWCVRDGRVWFTNWSDQRLYRLDPGGEPTALSAEPAVARGERWADGDVSPDGRWLLCVRERHPADGGPADVVNEIVRLEAHGDGPPDAEVVVTGPDFVSDPRWSRDGRAICWLEWDHPDMPWDATRLMVREGDGPPVLVAGGDAESVGQPRWHEDGSLWFLSDRTGWWNLYRWTSAGGVEPMVVVDGEIGEPQWVFGQSRYAFLPGGRVAFGISRDGFDSLMVREADGSVRPARSPVLDDRLGGGRWRGSRAHRRLADDRARRRRSVDVQGGVSVLRPPRDLGLPDELFSVPEPIEFPTGRPARAPPPSGSSTRRPIRGSSDPRARARLCW